MDDFDYLDECFEKWEALPSAKRNRKEQAVVDVCGTIAAIEGDSVMNVWREWGDSMGRIIESFRMSGASEIGRLLEESSFCREILSRTSLDADDWDYNEGEEKRVRDIDLRIGQLAPNAREGLLGFLMKRRS